MKFLIDGSASRYKSRWLQWYDGVAGQLITPLTGYSNCARSFAIDNGAYSGFDRRAWESILKREWANRSKCLFVCAPDKVGSHKETVALWGDHWHLMTGWKRAFVAQDGFAGAPPSADCIFIGGTTKFKDSKEAEQIVSYGLNQGLHIHIGRVNGPTRFWKFHDLGAHTCDGSGVSRFDYMIEKIRDARS